MAAIIKIANVAIHKDQQGQYCLNDFLRASSNRNRDTPGRFICSQHLTSQSNALTALLPVFDVLTSEGQKNALVDCHELATDVSIDLSAWIGAPA